MGRWLVVAKAALCPVELSSSSSFLSPLPAPSLSAVGEALDLRNQVGNETP